MNPKAGPLKIVNKETKTLEFPSTAFLKIFALLGIFYILAEAQGYFDKNA